MTEVMDEIIPPPKTKLQEATDIFVSLFLEEKDKKMKKQIKKKIQLGFFQEKIQQKDEKSSSTQQQQLLLPHETIEKKNSDDEDEDEDEDEDNKQSRNGGKRQFKTFTKQVKEEVSQTYMDEALQLFSENFDVSTTNEQIKLEFLRKFFLKKLMASIDIDFQQLEDLYGIEFSRDLLLSSKVITELLKLKEPLKSVYHSDMLSCLHNNSQSKQRFPAICMIRQILKAQQLKLSPRVKSKGYDKLTGKKEVTRHFVIEPLDK